MSHSQETPLVILGGNGPAAAYLMRQLASAGLTATVISRRPFDAPQGFTKLLLDLNNQGEWSAPTGAIIISLLPLWILTQFLPRLTKAKAIIATSSTSRFSKTNSSDAHERLIAETLTRAEGYLQHWAEDHSITWTLLRPTLIYDGKTDRNIIRMARFIQRWRFFPIAIPANGLRQPIHTDDVAKAAFKCLANPAAANKAFNISGGEILSYRAMVERVFAILGQKPRFIRMPVPLLQKVFRVASAFGIVKESSFGAAIFQRMNEDLIFDTAEGLTALDYQPRPFKPDFFGL